MFIIIAAMFIAGSVFLVSLAALPISLICAIVFEWVTPTVPMLAAVSLFLSAIIFCLMDKVFLTHPRKITPERIKTTIVPSAYTKTITLICKREIREKGKPTLVKLSFDDCEFDTTIPEPIYHKYFGQDYNTITVRLNHLMAFVDGHLKESNIDFSPSCVWMYRRNRWSYPWNEGLYTDEEIQAATDALLKRDFDYFDECRAVGQIPARKCDRSIVAYF